MAQWARCSGGQTMKNGKTSTHYITEDNKEAATDSRTETKTKWEGFSVLLAGKTTKR